MRHTGITKLVSITVLSILLSHPQYCKGSNYKCTKINLEQFKDWF